MSQPWNAPERDVTPPSAVLHRRNWLKRIAWGGAGLVGAGLAGGFGWYYYGGSGAEVVAAGRSEAPGADLYPAALDPRFADAGRATTDREKAARYVNYYEFSSNKRDVWRKIESFSTAPWKVEVTGLVSNPCTYDIDDLVRTFPLEERIYRHRCVETWAMVVPWTGFPLRALIEKAGPQPAARFVRFVSFSNPREAPGQRATSQPWPYNEGLTLEEAKNELAFLVTGMYGEPLLKQHGAPVRLVVPWKYGFKSAKALVRIELTDQQPATFWNTVVPTEYDFTANVNPDVPHPRWSQKSESMLGTNERFPTVIYNGYGEWVGRLYS